MMKPKKKGNAYSSNKKGNEQKIEGKQAFKSLHLKNALQNELTPVVFKLIISLYCTTTKSKGKIAHVIEISTFRSEIPASEAASHH